MAATLLHQAVRDGIVRGLAIVGLAVVEGAVVALIASALHDHVPQTRVHAAVAEVAR